MTISELVKIEAGLGIKEVIFDEKIMIQHIQIIEGHTPCFGSGKSDCKQYDCKWRNECRQYECSKWRDDYKI